MGEVWHEEAVTSRFFTKDGRLVNGTVAIVLMAWIIVSSFANLRRLYVFRGAHVERYSNATDHTNYSFSSMSCRSWVYLSA